MTQDALEILSGVLLVGAYVAQIADYVMTIKGIDRGLTEVGLVNRHVVAKWGAKALPAATFIEALVVTGLFAAWATAGVGYAIVFAGTFLVGEAVNDVRSAKLLGLV